MTICMIGDSHLAMMIDAAKEPRFEKLKVTPVTWPRDYHDHVSFNGTELCADHPKLAAYWQSIGLAPNIDLAAFDQLVLVSYSITAFSAFSILNDHAISDWNIAKLAIKKINAPMGMPPKHRLMTPAVFQECLAGLIRENFTFKLVDHLRQHSDIPIVVIPAPYLAENTLERRPRLGNLKRVLRQKDGAALAQSLHQAKKTTLEAFSNVTVLRQPEQTVVHGCLTQEAYRVGARRYTSKTLYRDEDILHAGPLLGGLYLEEICKLVETQTS